VPLVPIVSAANLLAQLTLAVIGLIVGFVPTAEETLQLLDWWCFCAVLYVIAVAIAVTVVARSRRSVHRWVTARLLVGRITGVVSGASTVLASLCGIAGAVQVKLQYTGADRVSATVIGTTAMLLSWMLLHWGHAQLYLRLHRRSPRPLLAFPGTAHPRLSDFVYFAFTVGTTFATSDVDVLDPRMRWAVAKHSILSFFYDGAIIVLALNTLTASG